MLATFVPPRLLLGATAAQTGRGVRALRLAPIDAVCERIARTSLPQGEPAEMLDIRRSRSLTLELSGARSASAGAIYWRTTE
jgi:hypothetical protein